MQTIGLDLAALIRDLAEIDSKGQLDELVRDIAAATRGEPRDRCRLRTAGELLRAQAVGRTLAQLFDLPQDACEAAARDVLLPQPRRAAALDMVNDYLGHSATAERLAAERQRRNTR